MAQTLSLPVKPWYLSKTIWGVVIAAAATGLQRMGVALDAGDQAHLVDLALTIAEGGGAALAIYGRAKAKGALSAGSTSGVSAVLICALALSLSACGSLGSNKQGYSGITDAEVKICAQEGIDKPFICSARILDGKERQNVALRIEHPDGWKVHYSATGVAAFDGQKARAAVDQAISQDVKDVAPAIVDTIMGAVTGVIIP